MSVIVILICEMTGAHTRSLFSQSLRFLIRQQRYLELLEARQTRKALSVLRDRLAPLNHGSDRLHQLSR